MDWGSLLWGQNAGDEQQKRVINEYWKLYTQAYNVKPIPVRTATGIEYRYPQGAVQRFQTLLPFLQQQMQSFSRGGGGGAGGKGNKGLMGELLDSSLGGLGKWGLDKLSGGKGWSGIFDKIWDYGKKGAEGLGDLFGDAPGTVQSVDVEGWGSDDPGTQIVSGLPSSVGMDLPAQDVPADDIFSAADPTFSDMVDYSTFADAPLDVADYQDWAWF